MLQNQGTNTGVTMQATNYNTNGDENILSEALYCITSSDLPQNQTLDNHRTSSGCNQQHTEACLRVRKIETLSGVRIEPN